MTAPAFMPSVKERSQADTMITGIFRDQHGREHAGPVHKDTQLPMGALLPLGWKPPLPTMLPPEQYRTYNAAARTFKIEYDAWAEEYAGAAREFGAWQLQVAQKMFGARALDAIKERDAKLFELTGEPPQHLIYLAAMKRGNPWALGLDPVRPQWADDAYASWSVRTSSVGSDDVLSAFDSLFDDDAGAELVADEPPAAWETDAALFADDAPVPARTSTRKR